MYSHKIMEKIRKKGNNYIFKKYRFMNCTVIGRRKRRKGNILSLG